MSNEENTVMSSEEDEELMYEPQKPYAPSMFSHTDYHAVWEEGGADNIESYIEEEEMKIEELKNFILEMEEYEHAMKVWEEYQTQAQAEAEAEWTILEARPNEGTTND